MTQNDPPSFFGGLPASPSRDEASPPARPLPEPERSPAAPREVSPGLLERLAGLPTAMKVALGAAATLVAFVLVLVVVSLVVGSGEETQAPGAEPVPAAAPAEVEEPAAAEEVPVPVEEPAPAVKEEAPAPVEEPVVVENAEGIATGGEAVGAPEDMTAPEEGPGVTGHSVTDEFCAAFATMIFTTDAAMEAGKATGITEIGPDVIATYDAVAAIPSPYQATYQRFAAFLWDPATGGTPAEAQVLTTDFWDASQVDQASCL